MGLGLNQVLIPSRGRIAKIRINFSNGDAINISLHFGHLSTRVISNDFHEERDVCVVCALLYSCIQSSAQRMASAQWISITLEQRHELLDLLAQLLPNLTKLGEGKDFQNFTVLTFFFLYSFSLDIKAQGPAYPPGTPQLNSPYTQWCDVCSILLWSVSHASFPKKFWFSFPEN